jgi:hypothetical protein
MRRSYQLVAGGLLLLLSACGQKQDPPPVKDTAFGDMVGTMDRARGVEGTVMQQKADTDKALNAAEGKPEQ